ncbi:OadG family protein [Acetivibrio saccincola]
MKFAFTITLIGTSIVFLSLIVLCVLMSFFPLLNYKRKKNI